MTPTIYIGLGGTGLKAIAKTKQLFENMYGKENIPEEIAFLGIDYDVEAANNSAVAQDMIQLTGLQANPRQRYLVGKQSGDYQWMWPKNSGYLVERIDRGARQVRTTGRFLSEMILPQIKTAVKNLYNRVRHMGVTSQKVDIHLVMSLAGGTGCGSFLNVALMIQKEFGTAVNLIGYGVLDGVFRAMDPAGLQTPRVVANAYSAILDLDYFMSASLDKPVNIHINNEKYVVKDPLFTRFYVVDNVTERGTAVQHVDELTEVIGTGLYVSGGPFGERVESVLNNIDWTLGNNNIQQKWAWVYGLGACQVVYKGDILARIYGLKAATNLIDVLRASDTEKDWNSEAIKWAVANKLKEDQTDDMLIDSIYNIKTVRLNRPLVSTSDSISSIKTTIDSYLKDLQKFPQRAQLEQLKKEKIASIQQQVLSYLQGSCGVGNALKFLKEIKSNVTLYLQMMQQEREEFENKATTLDYNKLIAGLKSYEEYCGKLFKRQSSQQVRLDAEVVDVAIVILKDNLEAERRKEAAEIFTALLAEITTMYSNIDALDRKLITLQEQYSNQISSMQLASANSLLFEIDLSANERTAIQFKAPSSFVGDFFCSLIAENGKIKSLYDVELSEELNKVITSYCFALPQADAYREKLIVDVIRDLSDKEYEALKREIISKSSRLLQLDGRGLRKGTEGHSPTDLVVSKYVYSAYQKKDASGNDIKVRFQDDNFFTDGPNGLKREWIPTDNEAMKQTMIFYRSDGSIIPYCIYSFQEHKVNAEYTSLLNAGDNVDFNPHFDKLMFEEMQSADFKLQPQEQDDALFYWIAGHLFGWVEVDDKLVIMSADGTKEDHTEVRKRFRYIRYNTRGSSYEYYDPKDFTSQWKQLARERDRAFQEFKISVLPRLKDEFTQFVRTRKTTVGADYYTNLINSIVPSDGNNQAEHLARWINEWACANRNSNTVRTADRGDWKQYCEEWEYFVRYFKNKLAQI